MREIKFRGLSKYSGKIVYGDFNHGKENVYVDDEPVEPESVAQLVGYDCDGKEIYEGDKVWGVGDFVYPAEISFDIDGSIYYRIGAQISNQMDSTAIE